MERSQQEQVARLKLENFRIKIPGGNEKNDTFASFFLCYRYAHKRLCWQGCFIPWRQRNSEERYDRIDEIIKFPEAPIQAASRELTEETGIIPINYEYIDSKSIEDNRPGYSEEEHLQYLFATKMFDASNIRRNLSSFQPNIGLPIWLDLTEDLEREVASEHLWMIHAIRRYTHNLPIPIKEGPIEQKSISPE